MTLEQKNAIESLRSQGLGYEAQVDYYTHYIQGREDWEFVSVYTDAEVIIGLTGKTLAAQGIAPI